MAHHFTVGEPPALRGRPAEFDIHGTRPHGPGGARDGPRRVSSADGLSGPGPSAVADRIVGAGPCNEPGRIRLPTVGGAGRRLLVPAVQGSQETHPEAALSGSHQQSPRLCRGMRYFSGRLVFRSFGATTIMPSEECYEQAADGQGKINPASKRSP